MDRDLGAKLMKEGPGILRAFIDGCLDWQKHGLVVPQCVEEQTDRYFETQDFFAQWFAECCDVNKTGKVSRDQVWQNWVEWAERRKIKPGMKKDLYEKLELKGFEKLDHVQMPDGKRPRGWRGFVLLAEISNFDFGPPPHTEYPEGS
jgi:putative DNA primase/helicase